MKATLIYLPGHLLQDRLFARDFIANYPKLGGRTLLVHSGLTDDPEQTSFTTKRLSGNLSEQMVPNSAFSGHQRSLIIEKEGAYLFRRDLLAELYKLVDCVVLNNLVLSDGKPIHAAPAALLPYLRDQLDFVACITFPSNSLSALGAGPALLKHDADKDRLLAAFDEEREAIELANALRPTTIASAQNYHV